MTQIYCRNPLSLPALIPYQENHSSTKHQLHPCKNFRSSPHLYATKYTHRACVVVLLPSPGKQPRKMLSTCWSQTEWVAIMDQTTVQLRGFEQVTTSMSLNFHITLLLYFLLSDVPRIQGYVCFTKLRSYSMCNGCFHSTL